MAKKFTTILRDAGAAARRAERERLSREREQTRQLKKIQAAKELTQASVEVALYEAELNRLLLTYKECSKDIDWEIVLSTPPPNKPEKSNQNELRARLTQEQYKPGLQDKLLRRVERKQLELEKTVLKAREKDEQEYQDSVAKYEKAITKHNYSQKLAKQVLSGNIEAYIWVLDEKIPFYNLKEIGVEVEITIETPSSAQVEVYVAGIDIIPSETKSLLKSGKLSVKSIPKTKYYGMYQDYVCGVVIRIARDLFALLPLQMIIVNAFSDTLNTKTGKLEETLVTSVAIPKDTIKKLNFDLIDPSDAMSNFVHNMKFTKTKGFDAVSSISLADLE